MISTRNMMRGGANPANQRAFAPGLLLLALAVALAAAAPFAVRAALPPGAERPNFVVFIADDQGEGDAGCYGNNVVRTPNIDRLARDGMRFDRAFLTISSCSPSRCSMLTGRYPHSTGASGLHDSLPASQKTVAQYLRGAGYYCAAVGKWHLGPGEKTHWDQVIECGGKEMAENSIRVLQQRPKDKPFFLWLASTDPHRPFQTGVVSPPHDPAKVRLPPYLPNHPSIRKELALYYDAITRWDEAIGRIRKEMNDSLLPDRCMTFYLSDNGMPFPRAKTTLFDSGIHTPLIVSWQGVVKSSATQRALVSVVDLAPTILDAAGVAQGTMQGRSFLPLLLNKTAAHRDAVFAEANWHDYEQFTRAVRTERYKLIRNYYWDTPLWNSVDSINSITWLGMLEVKKTGKLTPAQAYLFQPQRPFEEFYDLQKDPFELHNLAEDKRYKTQQAHLKTLLDNWRIETDDRMPAERRPDGWTRDGVPLPHNQPWYDNYIKQGRTNRFDRY